MVVDFASHSVKVRVDGGVGGWGGAVNCLAMGSLTECQHMGIDVCFFCVFFSR